MQLITRRPKLGSGKNEFCGLNFNVGNPHDSLALASKRAMLLFVSNIYQLRYHQSQDGERHSRRKYFSNLPVRFAMLWACKLNLAFVRITGVMYSSGVPFPGRHGQLTCNERESSIYDHAIDFCLTMLGWADVPDSDSVYRCICVSLTSKRIGIYAHLYRYQFFKCI